MMNLARQMYAAMDGILCTNVMTGGGRVTGVPCIGYRGAAGAGDRRFHGLEIGQIVTPRLASVLTHVMKWVRWPLRF